jgi:putative oxidoreductase
MNNLTRNVLAPLVLRLALAFFFAFQGMSKLGPDNGWGSNWHPKIHTPVQILIAWGQFLGGVALLLGFLTRLMALTLGGILIASIMAAHGAGGFDIRNRGVGFEYSVALLAVCAGVALLGGGSVALDTWLWGKKRP